jgi:hypothetical protein
MNQREYFVAANSFAAPVVSVTSTQHIVASGPLEALERFIADYRNPAALFAASVYESADAYHKAAEPLGRWMSNAAARRSGKPAEGRFELIRHECEQ